jgi:acyl dehydratase
MISGVYFDETSVGQVFMTAETRITREAIIAFAEAFDPQPQHISEETASRTPFGRLVASGYHTASVSLRQMVAAGNGFWVGALGLGIDEVRWPRPVLPGDTLRVRIEVVEARATRSHPDKGLVRLRTETINQDGAIVMTAFHTMLVARRPAEAA